MLINHLLKLLEYDIVKYVKYCYIIVKYNNCYIVKYVNIVKYHNIICCVVCIIGLRSYIFAF